MMFLHAVLLGLVQGVTEFLPISSSGHLILVPTLFGFSDQGLAVDAALHFATALAIFVYFRHDWWQILRSWRKKNSLLRKLIIASIPAAFFGVILGNVIEEVFRSPWIVVVMLILVAGVMWWVEKNYTQVKVVDSEGKNKDLEVGWLQALTIGLLQIVALIPGTSRSGITISGGMWQTLSRESAARFSFLLGAPITLGAGALNIPALMSLAQADRQFVITAGAVAFITAVVTMHWLLRFLRTHTLIPFVWYRVGLAILVIGFLLWM